jgi:Cys-tRNA(Pro)/Cys-tRNA(Cys) deacylase
MAISTPATRTLDLLGIPCCIFRHPQPPESLEQAARERGQVPEQIVRSIVFRIGAGQFVMVLMAGPGQISWKRVRTVLGISRLSMASESEVREVTGYQIGTVSPLGLPRPLRILADESVFLHEEISLGSGERGVALILKSSDLHKAVGEIETGQFAQR